MTNDEAAVMLTLLSEHFRCPVMPVDRYCNALRTWQACIRQRATDQRIVVFPDIAPDNAQVSAAWQAYNAWKEREPERGPESALRFYDDYADQVDEVFTDIQKSNLLARILYGGEQPRPTKCPEHHGHWHGCVQPHQYCPHGCMSGSNVTGWIP